MSAESTLKRCVDGLNVPQNKPKAALSGIACVLEYSESDAPKLLVGKAVDAGSEADQSAIA